MLKFRTMRACCAVLVLIAGPILYQRSSQRPPAPEPVSGADLMGGPGVIDVGPEFDGPRNRAAWDHLRLADPRTGRIPEDIRRKELAFAKNLPNRRGSILLESLDDRYAAKMAGWQSRGPTNLAGRTRALAIDVADPTYQTLLAGGTTGGLWRSTDAGASWTLVTGADSFPGVTSIAQDTRPGHENVWYYGTGEYLGSGWVGGTTYRGDGMFKSVDGGLSWSPLAATNGSAPEQSMSPWQWIYRVATDPSNPAEDEIYAATLGVIYRSVDGGQSFDIVLGDEVAPSLISDVVVSPTGVVYATSGTDGAVGGVFRSTDGVTFTDITPPGMTNFWRVVPAIAPSDENIVYFMVCNMSSNTDTGFWKYTYLSGDGSGAGGFWEDRSAQLTYLPGGPLAGPVDNQWAWNMMVTVHPQSADIVFLGARQLYRSPSGFAESNMVSWIGGYEYDGLNHHEDQHLLVFQPGSAQIAYSVNDNGLHRTDSVMADPVVWTPLNNGYLTGQFYTVAIDETTPGDNVVVGGTQDNGTWLTVSPDGATPWRKILGGDGFSCEKVRNDGLFAFYLFSAHNGYVVRTRIESATGAVMYSNLIMPGMRSDYPFLTICELDPYDRDTMYLKRPEGVWRNSYATATQTNWQLLTPIPDAGEISTIVASNSANHVLYWGTTAGSVCRLDGAAGAPMNSPSALADMGPEFVPGSVPSSFAIDPEDDQRVLMSVSNYGVPSLFCTEDGGATWTNVEGNLGGDFGPSVRAVAIVPCDSLYPQDFPWDVKVYFAATSVGLYSAVQLDGANTEWRLESPDLMGNAIVQALATRPADGTVVAATHGKGIYGIDLGDVAAVDDGESIPAPANLAQNVPNPFNPSTTIRFSLPHGGPTTLTVYDAAGRHVRTLLRSSMQAGSHEVVWDGADEGGRAVASGVYLYRLDSGNVHETRRMTLVR